MTDEHTEGLLPVTAPADNDVAAQIEAVLPDVHLSISDGNYGFAARQIASAIRHPTPGQREAVAAEREACAKVADTYQIGNQLFVMLRAFLDSAGVSPSECSVQIGLPSTEARGSLVDRLQAFAPPIGEFTRASSAQAGNYGGFWQGVEYDFAIRNRPPIAAGGEVERYREALERVADECEGTAPQGVPVGIASKCQRIARTALSPEGQGK